MRRYFLLLFIPLACTKESRHGIHNDLPQAFNVTVSNPLDITRYDEMVVIAEDVLQQKAPDFNRDAFVVLNGDEEIASQYNNTDTRYEGIVALLDSIDASGEVSLTIRYKTEGAVPRDYPKRTQAELSHKEGGKWVGREYDGGSFRNVSYLRVPPEHKDHSWFIRYEGPGWESDKVGYRFYLDQRNAVDVFGKRTSEMVLQQVGLDGFDSYHNMQPWGMDVMKVGASLGVGSIGAIGNGAVLRVEKTDSVTCRILENGDVYSSFVTAYYGWKVGDEEFDVKSHIGIHGGSRVSHQLLTLDQDVDSLCTGIVKDPSARAITSNGDASAMAYIATYGQQSLNSDNLGLAVFFHPANLVEFSEDANSHIAVLKTHEKTLAYFFLAAWIGEPGGIKNENEFMDHVSRVSTLLANPLKVKITE